MLEPPIPLPDFDNGGEVRSPQNPFNEEASAVRIMNAVRAHARLHGNADGTPGDFINPDGLIEISRFDAQGHRGGRNLRPENTLPAMEVALDFLMSTLELDTGITSDRVPVVDHDPLIQAEKCRRADGRPYTQADEVLIKDLTASQIQSKFICDKGFRGPEQSNNLNLSPVSVAFAQSRRLKHPYVMPTLQQVFDFVNFYQDYYRSGPGSSHSDAARRWRNAEQIRFNIETKVNPRAEFNQRTIGPKQFARTVARVIEENELDERADIQSFDFRTLLEVNRRFQHIRTVYLFGDFPIFDDPSLPGSDDGTNLQDEDGRNTPWLAGMFWPYRITAIDHPFRSRQSGGFEGMALSSNGRNLLPLLEQPLVGGEDKTLLIHEFDLAQRKYTGERFKYVLNERGTNIGDFIMFDRNQGLVIERDASMGDLNGFKAIYEIELRGPGEPVEKRLLVDLLRISDPHRISLPGSPGDVGIGELFAFPFVTIEDVIILDRWHIGVLNDNNFPFSLGRHLGTGQPDDNEFIIIQLCRPLR